MAAVSSGRQQQQMPHQLQWQHQQQPSQQLQTQQQQHQEHNWLILHQTKDLQERLSRQQQYEAALVMGRRQQQAAGAFNSISISYISLGSSAGAHSIPVAAWMAPSSAHRYVCCTYQH
jgi:hypothetical protein